MDSPSPSHDQPSVMLPGEISLLKEPHPGSIDFPQMDIHGMGKIYLTNFKLYFAFLGAGDPISIPLATISSCSAAQTFGGTFSYLSSYAVNPDPSELRNLDILTKDMRRLSFSFTNSTAPFVLLQEITKYSFWKQLQLDIQNSVFAFAYRKHEELPAVSSKFDFQTEFTRLGLNSNFFRISKVNSSYQICSSYPSEFIVPANASDELLKASAKFRSNGRLPVITWVDTKKAVTLSRCSQPCTSVTGYISNEDQTLTGLLVYSGQLVIIDARAHSSASANCFIGGGYETPTQYNCQIEFQNIDNIHAMRKSFKSLVSLSYVAKTPDRQAYEATKWLNHVGIVLQSACNIVDMMHNQGKCVLVHCTDGWDRTSQLVSLAQLFLDPYFRTIEGFPMLIRKDWLSFGHQFETRIGHGKPKESTGESPTFVQWMDCVFQCLKQFPNWFEFNESFLIDILDELYNCRFGTFLMDSEKARQDIDIDTKTNSLWSFLANHTDKYLNGNYFHDPQSGYFLPRTSTADLHVWTSYYGRYRATMKFHHLHTKQTLDRQQTPSFIVEGAKSTNNTQEADMMKAIMTKMFNKEIQQQIENARTSGTPGSLILELNDQKLKLTLENNKIRLALMSSPNTDTSPEIIEEPDPPKFCRHEGRILIEDYRASDEVATQIVMDEAEFDEFLRDVVQIEASTSSSTDTYQQPQGLSSYVPNPVMSLYSMAVPAAAVISSIPQVAVGGLHSVANWWYQNPS